MRIEDVKVDRPVPSDDGVWKEWENRPITESELLTLVADLAEKVWWCEVHSASESMVGGCMRWLVLPKKHRDVSKGCRMAERFLLPVGVLVDGPAQP